MFGWATPETAARLRRTIVLTVAREQRREALAEPERKRREPKKEPVEIVRLQACSGCGAKNRGDAIRCLKCRKWMPAAKE
jgi:hypothetical protein